MWTIGKCSKGRKVGERKKKALGGRGSRARGTLKGGLPPLAGGKKKKELSRGGGLPYKKPEKQTRKPERRSR